MAKYRSFSFAEGLKLSVQSAIKANKIKLIAIFALVLVAMSTGIFVALKSNSTGTLYRLQDINLDSFSKGVAATSHAFFGRTISITLNVVILTGLAFAPSWLFPLACSLFMFRGYLFGLNFALIFVFYGVGSVFSAVLIILPCQLLTLFALIMYYLVLKRININCQKFGGSDCNRALFIAAGFAILMLINLAETLLLCLLSGRVILVI